MANQYFVFKKLPELGEEFIIENQAAAHHIFTVMRAKVVTKSVLFLLMVKLGCQKSFRQVTNQ